MVERNLNSEWTFLPPRGLSQLVLLGREICPNTTKAIQGTDPNKYKMSEDVSRKHHLVKTYRRPWRILEVDRYGIPLTDNTNQLVRGGRLNFFRKVVVWRCWYCKLRVCVEKPETALARKVSYDEAYGPWMHHYRTVRKMINFSTRERKANLIIDPVIGREMDMEARQPWLAGTDANHGETWQRVGQLELDLQFKGDSEEMTGRGYWLESHP